MYRAFHFGNIEGQKVIKQFFDGEGTGFLLLENGQEIEIDPNEVHITIDKNEPFYQSLVNKK